MVTVCRALLPALTLALAVAAPCAAAETRMPPLRTLTFDVTLSLAETRVTRTSGLARAPVVAGGGRGRRGQVVLPPSPRGPAEQTARAGAALDAVVTASVVAATDDAGLVVDVTESGEQRERPTVRLAVTSDGIVSFDPKRAEDVTEEEVAIVRWLSRGFYGDHPTAPGTSWTVDQSANGSTDVERYRVLAADDARITLDYSLEERMPGATGYDASRSGSLVYDKAMDVPVRAEFRSQSHRTVDGAADTTSSTIAIRLRSDSFAKKGA